MIQKPEYILRVETDEIFSEMKVEVPPTFEKYLKDKSMTLVFSDIEVNFEDGKFYYKSKIYYTKQEFYLYLLVEDCKLVIYFKEKQLNELTLFIRQLLKQFKNGTINK